MSTARKAVTEPTASRGDNKPHSALQPATSIRDAAVVNDLVKQQSRPGVSFPALTRLFSRRAALVSRLRNNEKVIARAYASVSAHEDLSSLPPAAEWLLDNALLINEHLQSVREELPGHLRQRLPTIAEGRFRGCPRVMQLAWNCIAETDGVLSAPRLRMSMRSAQTSEPMTIGELWALPSALRFALIEQLRHAVCSWLTDRPIASSDLVRNVITSMRVLSSLNWADEVEQLSVVDRALSACAGFSYADFATRNLYRDAVETLARLSSRSEVEVAQMAVAAASVSRAAPDSDPGYFLLSDGRCELKEALGCSNPRLERLKIGFRKAEVWIYIGGILLTSLWLLSSSLGWLAQAAISWNFVVILGVAGLILAMDVAVTLINWEITHSTRATMLPGLELRQGVPAEFRTFVVVPVLLTSPAAIEGYMERLEEHYLACVRGEVRFALLSDWVDAATERTPEDESLLRLAREGIARLNRLYGSAGAGGPLFVLLHRRRRWSKSERCWMGWERKRGKLHELNRWLRGSKVTSFMDAEGLSPPAPNNVRFVVTVDADTRLPPESIRKLIGKMAHPLNRPVFDDETGRIRSGYAVLQPRVTPSLPVGLEGSIFQRVFSGAAGFDGYSSTVSEVYQDLFGEGSYAGKGIYDIDAFESALSTRVPDGTLLSHDLFEGIFARSGFASDVEVAEDFPSRYEVFASRSHRWVRGDWQLLPWIGASNVAHRAGGGGVSALGRWKMLDNLRRSLVAPSIVVALLTTWMLPRHAAIGSTGLIMASLMLPALLSVLSAVTPRHRRLALRSHFKALWCESATATAQVLLTTSFLAHQAWSMLDAIVRTLWRLLISRRNLLQWVTAAQTQQRQRMNVLQYYRYMAGGVVIAIAALLLVLAVDRPLLWFCAPFIALWLLAPVIAYFVSRSSAASPALVTAADASALRMVARRTWRYFETFVTANDHWLPPDNFQEDPQPQLARRTSPTNIGLYLLSVVSARDFGWLSAAETLSRIEKAIDSMRRLERLNGHFYNWYDTQTLEPLEPKYVSTVDSGNLAAHLIALANASDDWVNATCNSTAWVAGIEDCVNLFNQALAARSIRADECTFDRAALEAAEVGLRHALRESANSQFAGSSLASTVVVAARHLLNVAAGSIADDAGEVEEEMRYWAAAILRTAESWEHEVLDWDDMRRSFGVRWQAIANESRKMAMEMQFGFLHDPTRRLLSIGYRVAEQARDRSCYDLMASECNLTSFFAIAKRDLSARHWSTLGRPVTAVRGSPALVSWSGSMFEYLMPLLVLRSPDASLLTQTARRIVTQQIDQGRTHGVPWGASESTYSARDLEFTYQYSNFGVPELGLKQGLGDKLVIAPYATALAAMINPREATSNFVRLDNIGARGRYGFYDAVDYTPNRNTNTEAAVVVRAFMAHHQGMSIIAIANVIYNGRMRNRFHAEPSVRATELLLHERPARDVSRMVKWKDRRKRFISHEFRSAFNGERPDPNNEIEQRHDAAPSLTE